MAALSSYPLNRKNLGGKIILRLNGSEIAALAQHHGGDFFKQRFILRGTIRPFRCELMADPNGNRFHRHGRNRMLLVCRPEDLQSLNADEDVLIKRLILRDGDEGILVMETSDTVVTQTKTFRKRRDDSVPKPAARRASAPRGRKATLSREFKDTFSREFKAAFNRQFKEAKEAFNALLARSGYEIVEVLIKDGQVDKFKLRRDETL